jgi:ACR3 family arsenite efflux pump ArsB
MFEFYEFNKTNICIVLILIFIIYNILCKVNDKKNDNLQIDYLIIAVIFAFIISLFSAYVYTIHEEDLLTESYWGEM